ncbi:unnamed protein product [Trichobilharzia regenti]|nr:unnamed protein product [Trichobilharzia regenti]
MAVYLNYCRGMRFDNEPDYSYCRQLFRSLFHREGFTYDCIFDWNLLKFSGNDQNAVNNTSNNNNNNNNNTNDNANANISLAVNYTQQQTIRQQRALGNVKASLRGHHHDEKAKCMLVACLCLYVCVCVRVLFSVSLEVGCMVNVHLDTIEKIYSSGG